MDFPALVQRIVYPRTATPDEAWQAAANSGYGAVILALNRLLFGTVWLSSPAPVGPGLAHLGIGFIYILLALLAFRRSRLANTVILVLAVLEALIEVLINVVLNSDYTFSLVTVSVVLVLAIGGFRGANAIFAHYNNTRS